MQDFVMSPSTSLPSKRTRIEYAPAIVPFLPHILQFGSSIRPHWCKFIGNCSVSYTDLSRNKILNWTFHHSSAHVSYCYGRFHFIQAPCYPSFVYVAFPWSSSVCSTSIWARVSLSAAEAFGHCWKWEIPTPCRPVLVFPMMFCRCSMFSARSTEQYILIHVLYNNAEV